MTTQLKPSDTTFMIGKWMPSDQKTLSDWLRLIMSKADSNEGPLLPAVERFKNFAAASENGAVYIMESDWNDVYFTELEAFDGTRNVRHDDG